jgi:hypothetical protein
LKERKIKEKGKEYLLGWWYPIWPTQGKRVGRPFSSFRARVRLTDPTRLSLRSHATTPESLTFGPTDQSPKLPIPLPSRVAFTTSARGGTPAGIGDLPGASACWLRALAKSAYNRRSSWPKHPAQSSQKPPIESRRH